MKKWFLVKLKLSKDTLVKVHFKVNNILEILGKHYQKYFGKEVGSWGDDEVKILEYLDRPKIFYESVHVNTSISLGLSNFPLKTNDEKFPLLRMELVMCYENRFENFPATTIIYNISQWIKDAVRMPLPGEVIHLNRDVFKGYKFEKLYCFQALFTHPEFSVISIPNLEPIFIIWLIPIKENEWKKINGIEYKEFVKLLADHEPNLFDLERKEFDFI